MQGRLVQYNRRHLPPTAYIRYVHTYAGQQYKAQNPIQTSVIYIAASQGRKERGFEAWKPWFSGESHLVEVEGNHASLMEEPAVKQVAQTLISLLPD